MKNYPIIKVFLTKKRKFRAIITEREGDPTYEVTIGSNSWCEGKGRKYEETIKHRCFLIVHQLEVEMSLKFEIK